MKLDLGCGRNKREGFVGVDVRKLDGVDIVHDLTCPPWPFEADSIEEVYVSHLVEHLDGVTFMVFMDELWRVLQPGAKTLIIAPYYTSMRAWQDPTHQRAISEASFLYFNKQWREDNKLTHYPITCDFDFSYGYAFSPEWASRHDEARTFAVMHYWNVVADIHVTLTKRSKEA